MTPLSGGEDGNIAIEKIMALTLPEFQASLAALSKSGATAGPGGVRLPIGIGAVEISFEPLPPVLLGGLLELPRARVSLAFDNVPPPERKAFLVAFDIAFQRGGG